MGVDAWNVAMLLALPAAGKASREASPWGLGVRDRGRSEGRPVMGRIGVAPRRATSPRAKASRCPRGVSTREELAKRPRRQSRWREYEQLAAPGGLGALLVRPPTGRAAGTRSTGRGPSAR